ncbi:MAG: DUF1007 family protein [Campylobacterota bacterium]|nr:DUF1007 family protein [Campylobacterota bacterium]
MLKKFPLLFLLLYAIELFAHPHTFIEVYPTIEVKNEKTTKIHFQWLIDEMTSSMLIMEFDENGNGRIDNDENNYVYDTYFLPLKDYNFYTDIQVDKKTQFFPEPKNFQSSIKNNRICYSFDIDINYSIKNTKFDFGDEDFFVAMVLKDEFVNVKGSDFIVSDMDNDFYFGYRLELK